MSGKTKYTPPEVARMWGISADKVLAWIHSGELHAINVALKSSGRPRYRIDAKDLEVFESKRDVAATAAPRRKRVRRREPEQTKFY